MAEDAADPKNFAQINKELGSENAKLRARVSRIEDAIRYLEQAQTLASRGEVADASRMITTAISELRG